MPTAALPEQREHATSIIYDIRRALGISTIGTASTIGNTRTRRTVATLEVLEYDQLLAIRDISNRARRNASADYIPGKDCEYPDTSELDADEDCYSIRELLYKNQLSMLFLIAPAVDLMPNGMTIDEAIRIINQVITEMHDVTTPELVAAHILVGKATIKFHNYDPNMMLIVNTHPDKAETIINLFKTLNRIPTNREVITHHGISPVMYDGVL